MFMGKIRKNGEYVGISATPSKKNDDPPPSIADG
jgi:hypothetical protein